jgi:DNA-binding NtrC family response regulator
MKERILVIDDDVGIVTVLKTLLQREGFDVTTLNDSDKVIAELNRTNYDLVLSDVVMAPIDGMTLLSEMMESHPHLPVIMMTGHATVQTAIQAMKLGAFDYICKPFDIEELIETVHRALPFSQASHTTQDAEAQPTFGNLVGEHPAMHDVYDIVEANAAHPGAIAILGECGTGKTLLAHALHTLGPHADGPFILVNCLDFPDIMLRGEFFGGEAAAPSTTSSSKTMRVVKKGFFESANGGTLVVNEIGCVPLEMQQEFALVFRDKCIYTGMGSIPCDFRLILTTTEDLDEMLERGALCEELYYGLNIIMINVPALREHASDIPLLTKHFLHRYNRGHRRNLCIDMKAMSAIEHYTWPGNARELQSSLERSSNSCDGEVIRLDHLPALVRGCFKRNSSSIFGYSDEFDLRWRSLKQFLRSKEREYMDKVLRASQGDRDRAAEMMGISLEDFNAKYVAAGGDEAGETE